MLFELEHHEKFNILKIAEKKITAEYSAQLKAEFMQLAQENKSLICDLGQVDYSDSSGLSAFLIADRLFKEKNFVFMLCNLAEKVENIIKITKLDTVLVLINTLEEAKDYALFHEIEKDI